MHTGKSVVVSVVTCDRIEVGLHVVCFNEVCVVGHELCPLGYGNDSSAVNEFGFVICLGNDIRCFTGINA